MKDRQMTLIIVIQVFKDQGVPKNYHLYPHYYSDIGLQNQVIKKNLLEDIVNPYQEIQLSIGTNQLATTTAIFGGA